jgi:HPt (histidine-containing phosphotransfer) domain-containing protein
MHPSQRVALKAGGEGAENTRIHPFGKAQFEGMKMARRDITGAVDFAYLEDFAAGDQQVVNEVLALFREQADLWTALLDPASEGWRDAVHTIKGASRGVGANAVAQACEGAERHGPAGLDGVRDALNAALADIAAYAHEQALKSLRAPR